MSATVARPALSACLELLKPVTWFAPMWAYSCGIVSSGLGGNGRWHLIVAGLLLTGPLVCGTSQAINDWYDRHVDAINESHRPIPSGRIPGDWGFPADRPADHNPLANGDQAGAGRLEHHQARGDRFGPRDAGA
jgi:heme O synthase-like polyprenyltransferase